MTKNKYSIGGFTLAEVLITLGIIGIVAAMTLPSLVGKYKEKQRVTQLKKAYSILNQAFLMAVKDYGTPDNWGLVQTVTGEVDEEGEQILDNSGSVKAMGILKKYIYCGWYSPCSRLDKLDRFMCKRPVRRLLGGFPFQKYENWR